MRIWGPRYPVCRTVIVNTKAGTSFRGVLWRRRGGYLVLREAEILAPRGTPTKADGEVLVPEVNVEFLQVLDG